MLETYRFSGDRRIVEQVRASAGRGGGYSYRAGLGRRAFPPRATPSGRLADSPAALFYLATGRQPREASRRAFRWIDENHLLPYGVASGEDLFAGVGGFPLHGDMQRDRVDLVDSPALPHYRRRSFGDSVERAFFNAGPAPVARDFQTMSYYQSPNRIHAGPLPAISPIRPASAAIYSRNWAIRRSSAAWLQSTASAKLRDAHVDGHRGPWPGGDAVRPLKGVGHGRRRALETHLPNGISVRGDNSCRSGTAAARDVPAYFRIPDWCAEPRIGVNGVAGASSPTPRALYGSSGDGARAMRSPWTSPWR